MLRLRVQLRTYGLAQRQAARNFSYTHLLKFPRNTSQLKQETPSVLPTPKDSFAKSVRPSIRNQVLFFILGSSAIFTYSAWTTDIETATVLHKLKSQSSIWSVQTVTNIDLIRFQQSELVQRLRSYFTYLNTQAAEIPKFIQPYLNVAYIAIFQPFADASEGRRFCWKICLLNSGIWIAWQLRRMRPFMSRAFVHQPLSGLSYTLLTSAFSHKSFLHLAFNCLALEGFGSAAYTYLAKSQAKEAPAQLESTSVYHFLAFYLSAGIFSGLVSHIVNTKFKYPKLIAQLSSPANRAPVTDTWASAVSAAAASTTKRSSSSSLTKPISSSSSAAARTTTTATATAAEMPGSLGASGAVYACLTMTALAFPSAQISLIFPPTYPIDIQTGVMGMVALDAFGIYRGWRLFDHWAHLGGAAFGAMYFVYGPRVWSRFRSETRT